MTQNRIESATTQPAVPPILISWLAVFRPCFTAPVWNHILVLVGGAVLAPGKRTVTQALRVMGLADKPGFGRYHEVLNRARWDPRDVARRLLLHLLAVLSPSGEVVVGIDDTIERRWGGKIKARGIYRDAVRSSHGHFVKTSGLRWLSLAVMLPVPFAGRRWALPFLTVLALFFLNFLGLGVSVYPYLVPRAVTIWDAAAPPQSQLFMLIGTAVIFPVIIGYTAWAYWVFRGKAGAHGYH